jgi:hypothetical protein
MLTMQLNQIFDSTFTLYSFLHGVMSWWMWTSMLLHKENTNTTTGLSIPPKRQTSGHHRRRSRNHTRWRPLHVLLLITGATSLQTLQDKERMTVHNSVQFLPYRLITPQLFAQGLHEQGINSPPPRTIGLTSRHTPRLSLTDEQFNITSLVGINIPEKGNNEGAITMNATNTCTVSLSHSLVTLLDHPAALRGVHARVAAPDEPADHIVLVPKDSLVTLLDHPAALRGVHARVAAPDEPTDHPTSQIGTGNYNGNDAHSTNDDTASAPIYTPTKERENEGVDKTGTTGVSIPTDAVTTPVVGRKASAITYCTQEASVGLCHKQSSEILVNLFHHERSSAASNEPLQPSSARRPLPPLSARMAGVALRDAEGAPLTNEGVPTPTSATNNLPHVDNDQPQLNDLLDSESYHLTVAETKNNESPRDATQIKGSAASAPIYNVPWQPQGNIKNGRYNTNDFIGPLQRANTQVNGIGGHQNGKWIAIPAPKGSIPFYLLLPQHFGQENFKRGIDTHSKGSLNMPSGIDNWPSWGDLKYTVTTQLTQGSTIALLNTDSGYSQFSAFANLVDPVDEPPDFFHTHLIPDDEDPALPRASRTPPFANDIFATHADANNNSQNEGAPTTIEGAPTPTSATNSHPHIADFLQEELCLPTVEETEDESKLPPTIATNNSNNQPHVVDFIQSELRPTTHAPLLHHYWLSHQPFKNLLAQQMASREIFSVPQCDASFKNLLAQQMASRIIFSVPQCDACHSGKASVVVHCKQGMTHHAISVPQCDVSCVPQCDASFKNLLAQQMASRVIFSVPQCDACHSGTAPTVMYHKQAMHAFEGYAHTMGIKVLNYHADTGRICENVFIKDVANQGQNITFCGVNAHFQSGVAERRIQELQDGARTSLIHAKHRWGSAINAQLWPYALRHRNDVFNATQKEGQKLSPLEAFSNSNVHPKWLSRAKPVVYLGTSPHHARSISLVLDLETAHVSPQFHLRYDSLFETVSPGQINPQAQVSNWQKLCGFRGPKPRTNVVPRAVVPDPVGVEPPDPAGDPDVLNERPLDGPEEQGDFESGPTNIPTDHTDAAVGPFGNPLDAPANINNIPTRRSGQNRTLTQRFVESPQQRDEGLVAFVSSHEAIDPTKPDVDRVVRVPPSFGVESHGTASAPVILNNQKSCRHQTLTLRSTDRLGNFLAAHETIAPLLSKQDRALQQREVNPVAFNFTASSVPGTVCYHKTMKEPDAHLFLASMAGVVNNRFVQHKPSCEDATNEGAPYRYNRTSPLPLQPVFACSHVATIVVDQDWQSKAYLQNCRPAVAFLNALPAWSSTASKASCRGNWPTAASFSALHANMTTPPRCPGASKTPLGTVDCSRQPGLVRSSFTVSGALALMSTTPTYQPRRRPATTGMFPQYPRHAGTCAVFCSHRSTIISLVPHGDARHSGQSSAVVFRKHLSTVPCHRTRHINAAWHHFRSYVVDKIISIHYIDTKSQLGDVFTQQVYFGRLRPLPQAHLWLVAYGHSERRSESIMCFDQARRLQAGRRVPSSDRRVLSCVNTQCPHRLVAPVTPVGNTG